MQILHDEIPVTAVFRVQFGRSARTSTEINAKRANVSLRFPEVCKYIIPRRRFASPVRVRCALGNAGGREAIVPAVSSGLHAGPRLQFDGMRVRIDLAGKVGLAELADVVVEEGNRNDERIDTPTVCVDEGRKLPSIVRGQPRFEESGQVVQGIRMFFAGREEAECLEKRRS